MTLDELKAKLDTFSPAKIAFVANIVESLSNPSRANIRSEDTWLTAVREWIEYFGLARSVHRAATTIPLGLTSFETVFRNITVYHEAVTAILMLRAFLEASDRVPNLYQLVEVPVSLFDSIQKAPLSAFRNDAPVIPCTDSDGRVVARVALDRSDAKITVRSILLDACIVHADWTRL